MKPKNAVLTGEQKRASADTNPMCSALLADLNRDRDSLRQFVLTIQIAHPVLGRPLSPSAARSRPLPPVWLLLRSRTT